MSFRDRRDAGKRLAAHLGAYRTQQPVVVGLPRGGVVVAAEVARVLDAPLDVALVRKLGAPGHPELGIGAIAEGGVRALNEDLVQMLGVSEEYLQHVERDELAELERRQRVYRGDRPPLDVAGRTVIVVDDGLATGYTARAAVRAVRARGAAKVVLAVPVSAADTEVALREEADEVVCDLVPRSLMAIGQWYENFAQTTDKEVIDLLAAARKRSPTEQSLAREVSIGHDAVRLPGTIEGPEGPLGVVVFAHGSGSSRYSPRNRAVAASLNRAGLATLLFDLLTPTEAADRANVFDIPLLAQRLGAAVSWLRREPELGDLAMGLFGASTGAAAALWAAADHPDHVAAVVSRGGRPDLAAPRLSEVKAPTLLVVGARDRVVLELNQEAARQLGGHQELVVIPGAGHLFEEAGALDLVAEHAAAWFVRWLRS